MRWNTWEFIRVGSPSDVRESEVPSIPTKMSLEQLQKINRKGKCICGWQRGSQQSCFGDTVRFPAVQRLLSVEENKKHCCESYPRCFMLFL